MRILITGYYGAGNFGDDIMLESFCKEMKIINPKIKIDILKLFDRELNIELDNDVKIIDFYKLGRKVNTIVFMTMMKMKYDMFLWVGGTCFTDEDGDGLHHLMKRAKQCGKKIGYIGVGVGNLTNPERIEKTNYLLNLCDFISLRDKRSYEYARKVRKNKNNIYLTEDLAYLFINKFNINKNKKEENNTKKILVSWRNLINYRTEEEEKELINRLVNYLETLSEKNFDKEIIIIPLDDRKDCEKNKYIYDRVKRFENNYTKVSYNQLLTPREKIKYLLECDVNISARLHGIFVSELCNIKTIAISYSIKINEFLQSIGKECDCINLDDLNEEKIDKVYNLENSYINEDTIMHKINTSKENIYLLNKYLMND